MNEYSNAYHRTIIMKPVDVEDKTFIDFGKENNDKDPSFKLVIMEEYQNAKTFLLKDILPIGLKKFW